MKVFENDDIGELIKLGREQGFLTYEQVTSCMPDQSVGAERLELLLVELEKAGIELVDSGSGETESLESIKNSQAQQESELAPVGRIPRPSDDPIRTYLSQMSVIPLLSRDEEVSLAKRIEITRRRYRRAVMCCNYSLSATIEILKRVYRGELPFDRTIKVSLTENLTKEQIQARMPHHFRTIDQLQIANAKDFQILISKSAPKREKQAARLRFMRRKAKLVILIEELSLRSRRISPMIKQLDHLAQRMMEIRTALRATGEASLDPAKRMSMKEELARLVLQCQASPEGLDQAG